MHCKICRKRKLAPSAEDVPLTEKACSRCGAVKGASSFYVDKQAQSGLEARVLLVQPIAMLAKPRS